MIINISRPDQSISIDGQGVVFKDFSEAEIPKGVKSVHMDIDKNEGLITWEDSCPNMPITNAQFKAVFYHCVAMHENAIIKLKEQEAEAMRGAEKLKHDALAAAHQKQIDDAARENKLVEMDARLKKLEEREVL